MKSFGKLHAFTAEKSLLESPLGRRLCGRFKDVEVRDRISPQDYSSFDRGDLILARHQGSFIKPCPGTNGYICCGLQIIHLGLGCNIDCSYCILQGYLDTEALVVFGNVEEACRDLETKRLPSFDGPKRYCTGEFTDSLLLEDLTGIGGRLVETFSRAKGAVLELKTKTTNIDSLLDLDHGGRTIISFSVNAPAVSRSEEPRAAPLEKRLQAATRAVGAGYRVGFHFDPLLRHPGWEDGYSQTVSEIYDAVPKDRIAWISMGAFRYLPRLKNILRRRRPETRIMDEEFILAPDGKMRYLRPVRVDMYRCLLSAIHAHDPAARVYMCMESPRVWREVFGFSPVGEGLIEMMDGWI